MHMITVNINVKGDGMIYIYNDYGGTHSTALAAAFHLKILTAKSLPLTKKQILSVPYFNKLKKTDAGKLFFHGKDEDGNAVYTLGRKRSKLVVPAMTDLSYLFLNRFDSDDQIIFSNTSPTVPFLMTIGGGLSRGLGIDSLGVPLLVKGAQQTSATILALVENTKQQAARTNEQVLVLDNKEYHGKIKSGRFQKEFRPES